MPDTSIQAPADAVTLNGWSLEVNDNTALSVTKVDGLSQEVGSIESGDGGTGHIFKFSDQRKNYGTITITRLRNPADTNDSLLTDITNDFIANGTKVNGVLKKYHFGTLLFRILFQGMGFKKESHPSLDKAGAGAYEMVYEVDVDFWEQASA